jgi:subtilisin family serine protease
LVILVTIHHPKVADKVARRHYGENWARGNFVRVQRYAVFKPASGTISSKAGCIDLDTSLERSSLPSAGEKVDRLSGFEGMRTSAASAEADQVTFIAGPEPPVNEDGSFAIRAPLMPVRVIPQIASAADSEPAEPWGLRSVGALQSQFTGSGVCVAVLDTGIDADHPAFAGLIRDENYTSTH